MKTDPTQKISPAAGTPLSQTAIEFGRNGLQRMNARPKPADTISDTLETSDREADGRQPLQSPSIPSPDNRPSESTGERLDLTG